MIGTYTRGRDPSVVPSNPSGVMPTIVIGCPLTTSVSPTTAGLPSKRCRQYAWLSTTTLDWPGALSSFASINRPAERGQTQHAEVAARDEHAVALRGLAAVGQVGVEEAVGGNTSEDRLLLLEIAKHQVAEDAVAAAGVVARLRSRLRPGTGEVHQRLRVGTGSGRSRNWLNSEKIAALAPMPSASETIATTLTKGVRNRARKASRRLVMSGFDEISGRVRWVKDSGAGSGRPP